MMSNPVLLASNVYKSFGLTPALQGASMDIEAGEVVAIMGPSGSGKSTLLHCLAGILLPDDGEVWFGDQRVDQMGEDQRSRLRRTEFGFVFQFGQLVPELTAVDNVALPLLFNGARRHVAYDNAQTWLHTLGLDGMGDRRTGELSGGQAQRVAIARAMVIQPRVIFADEPTGSLDSWTGEKVLDVFLTVARTQGTAVVIVTHEARVAANADREVMVRDGVVRNSVQGSMR